MPNYHTLKDIKIGMLLAEDLTNKFGQTLAKAGSKITEVHLKMLQTWSIDGVLIKSNNEPEQDISPEDKIKYLKKINSKIGFQPTIPIEIDLSEALLHYFLKHKKVEISR